jgi:hypothetical protein
MARDGSSVIHLWQEGQRNKMYLEILFPFFPNGTVSGSGTFSGRRRSTFRGSEAFDHPDTFDGLRII